MWILVVPDESNDFCHNVGENLVYSLFTIPRTQPGSPSRRTIPLTKFIVGPENQLVAHIARTIGLLADNSLPWNPLVLYGNSGNGKTEFLKFLTRQWTNLSGGQETMLIEGSRLSSRFSVQRLQSIKSHLRNQLRTASLLAIDDIDVFSRRPTLQHFIVQCIDECLADLRPVVVTSTLIPHSGHLLPRLASRLRSGLVVPILEPATATRQYAVRELATAHGLTWTNQTIANVASRMSGPIPQLNRDLCKYHVSRVENVNPRQRVNKRKQNNKILSEITRLVSQYFQVPANQLKGRSRRQSITHARCLAIYIAREIGQLTYAQIGEYFGRRDHSTVMNAYRKASVLLSLDGEIHRFMTETANQCREKLKAEP